MAKITQTSVLECQIDNDSPQELHKWRLEKSSNGALEIHHTGGLLCLHLSVSHSTTLTFWIKYNVELSLLSNEESSKNESTGTKE